MQTHATTRRFISGALFAAAAVSVGLWAALGAAPARAQSQNPASTPAPPALQLAVSHGTVSLPIYVADAHGFFAAEGLRLQLRDCSSGRHCFQMLSQGQVDLATAAELVVTLDSFKRADFAIVATLSESSRQIKVIARRSASVLQPDQLRGKRVATVPGTSAQFFLDSWLLFHEVDPRSVVQVPMAPEQLAGALQRHEVDAVAIWEPLASQTAAALGTDVSPLPSPRVYTQHFSLIAERRLIGARDAELQKLLRALARAQRFIADKPLEAAQILAARLQLGGAAVAASLREHDFRLRLDQSLLSTMDSQARWAVREGLVDTQRKPGNLLRSVESGPLRRSVPGAVDLLQ